MITDVILSRGPFRWVSLCTLWSACCLSITHSGVFPISSDAISSDFLDLADHAAAKGNERLRS